jgi:serine/threonine-protein kinase SRPK3
MLNLPLDLHLGNMGSSMLQIADQDPEHVMLYLGDHNITIVLPVLSAKRNSSLPAYILAPCNTLTAYYEDIAGSEALPRTILFDFGNGELTLCRCTLLSGHILYSA